MLLLSVLLLLSALPALAETAEIEEGLLPSGCLPVQLLDPSDSLLYDQSVIDAALQMLVVHHPGDEALQSAVFTAHANRVLLSDGRKAWLGSIFGQVEEMPIEAVVTFDDVTGSVLRYEENNTGWFQRTQSHWENTYGRYGVWPLETQVLFDVLYCLEVTHATPVSSFLSEERAYEKALEAAGLTQSRNTLHGERSLVLDPYATDPTQQYVWMITLCLGADELAQVNISATDGNIMDVFVFGTNVG